MTDENDGADASPHLVCVEYPGTIRDEEKMLETLGGYEHINEIFSQPNRRLELRYRPTATGCKPTCAERGKTSSLLIKAKLMKNQRTGETKIEHEIVGSVEATYQFTGLCDFQYMPMTLNQDDKYTPITVGLEADRLPTLEEMTKNEESPLFLPPMAFSRIDHVQDYHFRREVRDEKTGTDLPENMIGRTRQRRSLYNCFLTLDAENVPDKPNSAALEQLENYGVNQEFVDTIKKMFEEQKLWLKAELSHKSQVPQKCLKYILPVVSYYFSSGPWRNQWVQLGHDPRKDRSSAPYQTLDYRLRLRAGARRMVESKRKTLTLSRHKTTNSAKARTSMIDLNAKTASRDLNEDELAEHEEKMRDVYIFRPGRLPPSRQVFYQYKNIQVPEAQMMIQKHLLHEGESCEIEKNGWYKRGLEEKLRNVLADTIKETCLEDDNISLATSRDNTMDVDEFSEDSEPEDDD